MKKKILIISITILAIAGTLAFLYYNTFYKANSKENDSVIYIYHDTDYQGLLDSLSSSGIIINLKTFASASKHMGLDTSIKAGRYIIDAGLSNKAITRLFANGWQQPFNFTLSGYIRTWEKMAGYLGDKFEADSASFCKILYNNDLRDSLGFTPEHYLAMFIPNTYEMYWTTTPYDFLLRMKKEYDAFWNESRRSKAAALNMTPEQVMTLAAIVIEETKYEPEMPTIAGVYLNRLKIGMPLQADPTVKYAVELQSSKITRILNRHLKIDSPYNTYTHKGLPPGPITIAPPVAIDAVLNYQQHNYIYFCAKETFDGQHNFASSYSKHLQNARAYQRALTARQKANAVKNH